VGESGSEAAPAQSDLGGSCSKVVPAWTLSGESVPDQHCFSCRYHLLHAPGVNVGFRVTHTCYLHTIKDTMVCVGRVRRVSAQTYLYYPHH
jgi:hypothetical protein